MAYIYLGKKDDLLLILNSFIPQLVQCFFLRMVSYIFLFSKVLSFYQVYLHVYTTKQLKSPLFLLFEAVIVVGPLVF